MLASLPQFVPQDVCLSCKGCCRFKEMKSPWRPRVMTEEAERIKAHPSARPLETLVPPIVDGGYVRALPCEGQFRCAFLNTADNTCGIYHDRPFECRLYPFLLIKRGTETAVAVHGSCPYVQDNRHTPAFDGCVAQLKTCLREKDVFPFLETQAGDYPGGEDEIETLFIVGHEQSKGGSRPGGLLQPTPPKAGPTAGLLGEKDLVKQYLSVGKYDLSAFSFVSIFAWKDFFDFDLRLIDNNLCVFARHEAGSFLYLPPLGKDVSPQTIDACFALMRETNGENGVSRIENVGEDQLAMFPGPRFAHYRKAREYCYRREAVAGLKGSSYKSKRSSCNQFRKNYSYQYLPYEASMREACLELYDRWAEGRRQTHNHQDIYRYMLEDNRKVHALVLEYHKELDLVGRVVSVDGRIKAYSFGYALNDEVFCVLFEIADLSLKGLSTVIFREFCADKDVEKYPFINAMDDFEAAGLRQAKMSFRPAVLLDVYVITQRSREKWVSA